MTKNGDSKCVLWGAYGNRNTGDQLTLSVALLDARAKFGNSVVVLSGAPVYTKWNFPDVSVIPYMPIGSNNQERAPSNLRQKLSVFLGKKPSNRLSDALEETIAKNSPWVQTLRRSQQLYLAGGGYLNSIFKLNNFLLPIKVANHFSIQVATAPLGLGPFYSKQDEEEVAKCLSKAEVVVRDRFSLETCNSNGIKASLKKDDGFRALEIFSDLHRHAKTRDNSTNPRKHRPLVGVCVFYQHGSGEISKQERWWVKFFKKLRLFDLDLEGFCFHPAVGLEFFTMVKLFSLSGWDIRLVKPPTLDFRAVIYSLSRYDIIISTRFHPIVLADLLDIPGVAFASGKYYTDKMNSIEHSSEKGQRLVNPDLESPEEIAKHVGVLC